MRRTLTVCRTGLSAAAALVLLTACGGSGDDTESSASRGSETTAEAANSEFCTEAGAVQGRVAATFSGNSDPATLPAVFQEAATQLGAIDPPEEIASDWASFSDGIQQIAAAAQIDFNDEAAVAAFEQEAATLQQEFAGPTANVQKYLSEECGFTQTPTETSAPTS
jgi:hypothetical protein